MRIHTKVVLDKDLNILEDHYYDHVGPVAQCKGSGTSTVEKSDPWEGIQPYLTGAQNLTGAQTMPSQNTGNVFGVPGRSRSLIDSIMRNHERRYDTPAYTTQNTSSVPGIYPEAARLYGEGSTLQGFSPTTRTALDRLSTPGDYSAVDPDGLTGFAAGDYVGPTDRVSQLIDSATGGTDFMSSYGDDILDSVNSEFAKYGRTGSGYNVDTATKELGNVASRLHSEDRNRELSAAGLLTGIDQYGRDKQLDATLASPAYAGQIESLRDQDTSQMLTAGQIEDDMNQAIADGDWDTLMRYASIIQPGAGIGGRLTSAGPGRNVGAGILGGAATGAGLAGALSLSNPWTAGLAAAGGLLGAY